MRTQLTLSPHEATAEDIEFAQGVLLEAARTTNAKDLRVLRHYLHEAIDPCYAIRTTTPPTTRSGL